MCVLLVEDDDLIRVGLTELLIDTGFEVLEAADAETALELARAMPPPRLVASDVNLGWGLDGLALAFTAHRRWLEVPVLLMSGFASNFADRPYGTAELFLLKPFSLVTFLQSVVSLAGRPTPRSGHSSRYPNRVSVQQRHADREAGSYLPPCHA